MKLFNQTFNHTNNIINGDINTLPTYLNEINIPYIINNDTTITITLENAKNDVAHYHINKDKVLKRQWPDNDFSATTIGEFLLCQKKWYKTYREKVWITNSTAFEFGTFVHEKLSHFPILDLIDENERIELKELIGISSWNSYFELIFSNLTHILEEYDILYQEKEYMIQHTDLCLHGTIDLVCRHKITGRYLVVDYKTYTRNPKSSEDCYIYLQLPIYSYLVKVCENIDNIDMMYISIPKKQVEPKVLKSGKLSRDSSQKIDKTIFLSYCAKNNIDPTEYLDFMMTLPTSFISSTLPVAFSERLYDKIVTTLEILKQNISNNNMLSEAQGYTCENCTFKEECKL